MENVIYNKNRVSYGQEKLIKLCEKRKLAKFCHTVYQSLDAHSEVDMLYHIFYFIACGRRLPSIKYIYMLRNYINPASWFYFVNEDKEPEDFEQLSDKTFDYTKSINFAKIPKGNMMRWCKQNNIPYLKITVLVNETRSLTYKKILDLKDVLPPEDWFKESKESAE